MIKTPSKASTGRWRFCGIVKQSPRFEPRRVLLPNRIHTRPSAGSRKPLGHLFFREVYNLIMTLVVSLRDFVGEMQLLSDNRHAYLNKVTGELVTISDEGIEIAQSDDEEEFLAWQDELVQDAKKVLSSDDYIELPSTFDIHEYEIMGRFCLSFHDEEISDALLGKIRGSGAFRRFKDTIYRYGIEKDWFKFRDAAYKEIAISWLEDKGFAYTDDLNG